MLGFEFPFAHNHHTSRCKSKLRIFYATNDCIWCTESRLFYILYLDKTQDSQHIQSNQTLIWCYRQNSWLIFQLLRQVRSSSCFFPSLFLQMLRMSRCRSLTFFSFFSVLFHSFFLFINFLLEIFAVVCFLLLPMSCVRLWTIRKSDIYLQIKQQIDYLHERYRNGDGLGLRGELYK